MDTPSAVSLRYGVSFGLAGANTSVKLNVGATTGAVANARAAAAPAAGGAARRSATASMAGGWGEEGAMEMWWTEEEERDPRRVDTGLGPCWG